MAKIQAIALVLNDNDYGSTFEYLLKSIWEAIHFRETLSEKDAEVLIREGIGFHYSAFQGPIGDEEGHLPFNQEMDYLSANLRVLFNEEAVHDCLTEYRDGGAWFLDVASGQVTSY